MATTKKAISSQRIRAPTIDTARSPKRYDAGPLLAVGLVDVLDHADEQDRERDRDRQRGAGRGIAEAPHDPLEDEAHQRREDAQHEEQRERDGEPDVHLELVVDERGDHPHRPVGEVEDAGGRVGEDEPAGGDGEDASGADADQRELEERSCSDPAPSVGPHEEQERARRSRRRRRRRGGDRPSGDRRHRSALEALGGEGLDPLPALDLDDVEAPGCLLLGRVDRSGRARCR